MYEMVGFVNLLLGFRRFAIRFVKVCVFKTLECAFSLCASEGLRSVCEGLCCWKLWTSHCHIVVPTVCDYVFGCLCCCKFCGCQFHNMVPEDCDYVLEGLCCCKS